MTPSEKSLAAVKDAIEILEGVAVNGKDAFRIVNCLAYLSCLKGELEKEAVATLAPGGTP